MTPTDTTAPVTDGPPEDLGVVEHARPAADRQLPVLRSGLGALVIAVGFAVPALFDGSTVRFLVTAGIMGLFALSLGWLAGHVGLVSLAHGVFYGGAGYTMAITLERGMGSLPSVLLALIFCAASAALIGVISIRVPGIGFAIVTLAFGQIAYLTVTLTTLRPVFGGFDGLRVPAESFLSLDRAALGGEGLWPLLWVCISASVVLLWLVRRSRFGLLLSAIKDNEERARFSGFSTYLPRVAAFTISGLIAGLAGALAAFNTAYVSPSNLYWFATAYALIAALLGGTSNLAGPFIGAYVILWVQDRFAASGQMTLYVGLLFIVVFVFFPAGITGILSRAWGTVAKRPAVARLLRTSGKDQP